jgi:UDPglucose 6-dehydrogenase
MAAAMASRGVRTIGVDIQAAPVEKIKKKLAPVWEPGLSEMILGCDGLLQATMDVNEAVHETDLTFVVVPTPSLPSGAFSLEYVCSVVRQIGAAIGKKDGYHLVVLSSTVLPGATEHVVLPLLEESSGKCRGMGFGLCYSPEFIALGSVLRDFLNPDFLLIGECDAASGKKLASFYANEMQINARIARMTPVNAELTKIALNTFVTTKITYANMLAEICERLPGGDVDVVTGALGLDARIGAKYLKGGLGYGGPCFPRDNKALAHFLDSMGVPAGLPRTVDQLNSQQPQRVVDLIWSLGVPKDGRVAVLGLAYKPNTNVVEGSQSVAIASLLAEAGSSVVVHDPLAIEQARQVLGNSVSYAASVTECLANAQLILVANDLPEYRGALHQTSNQIPRPIVLDAWRFLRPLHSFGPSCYQALGLGNADGRNKARIDRFVRSLSNKDTQTGESQAHAASSAD